MRAGDHGPVPSDTGTASAMPILLRAESAGTSDRAIGRWDGWGTHRCSDGPASRVGGNGRHRGEVRALEEFSARTAGKRTSGQVSGWRESGLAGGGAPVPSRLAGHGLFFV